MHHFWDTGSEPKMWIFWNFWIFILDLVSRPIKLTLLEFFEMHLSCEKTRVMELWLTWLKNFDITFSHSYWTACIVIIVFLQQWQRNVFCWWVGSSQRVKGGECFGSCYCQCSWCYYVYFCVWETWIWVHVSRGYVVWGACKSPSESRSVQYWTSLLPGLRRQAICCRGWEVVLASQCALLVDSL